MRQVTKKRKSVRAGSGAVKREEKVEKCAEKVGVVDGAQIVRRPEWLEQVGKQTESGFNLTALANTLERLGGYECVVYEVEKFGELFGFKGVEGESEFERVRRLKKRIGAVKTSLRQGRGVKKVKSAYHQGKVYFWAPKV